MHDALEKHRSQTPSEASTPQFEPSNPFEAHAAAAASIDPKPTREIPGEAFIGANETAGLPQMTHEEYREEQTQAAQEPQRRGFWSRFGFSSPDKKDSPPKKKSRLQDPDSDVEHTAEAFAAAPRFGRGTGILSNLLTLYDAANTPGTLTPANGSYEDLASTASGRPGRSYGRRLMRTASSASSLSGTEKTPPSSSRRTGFPFHEARPATARSGAGVFGALVASTANLSGPAAPTSSSLAPSVKRPGYHLSRLALRLASTKHVILTFCLCWRRYSLDANLPLAPPLDPPSRPMSVHFDTTGRSPRLGESPETDSPDTYSSTPPGAETPLPMLNRGPVRKRWSGVLKDLPKRGWTRTPASTPGTPNTDIEEWLSEKEETRPTEDYKKKDRRRRRKKVEVFVRLNLSYLCLHAADALNGCRRSPAMSRRLSRGKSSSASSRGP